MTKLTVGSIHHTKYGRLRIIEKWTQKESKARGFSQARGIIEFIDTGYVANVQISNIKQDKIRDRRLPSVYGVGYLDCDLRIPSRDSGSEVRRIYDLWANMIKRCYGNYKCTYVGVSVDPRWHSFKNFLNCVPELKGYGEWLKDSSMHLDKDIIDPTCKVYSKDTCQFVTAAANVSESSNRRWGNV